MPAKYGQKILHFYCYTCKAYELKTSPHYRAQRKRFAERKRRVKHEAIPALRINETISEIPEKLREIMRNNSLAVEKLLTKKVPC
jgi:hypothetical protein